MCYRWGWSGVRHRFSIVHALDCGETADVAEGSIASEELGVNPAPTVGRLRCLPWSFGVPDSLTVQCISCFRMGVAVLRWLDRQLLPHDIIIRGRTVSLRPGIRISLYGNG